MRIRVNISNLIFCIIAGFVSIAFTYILIVSDDLKKAERGCLISAIIILVGLCIAFFPTRNTESTSHHHHHHHHHHHSESKADSEQKDKYSQADPSKI